MSNATQFTISTNLDDQWLLGHDSDDDHGLWVHHTVCFNSENHYSDAWNFKDGYKCYNCRELVPKEILIKAKLLGIRL